MKSSGTKAEYKYHISMCDRLIKKARLEHKFSISIRDTAGSTQQITFTINGQENPNHTISGASAKGGDHDLGYKTKDFKTVVKELLDELVKKLSENKS